MGPITDGDLTFKGNKGPNKFRSGKLHLEVGKDMSMSSHPDPIIISKDSRSKGSQSWKR